MAKPPTSGTATIGSTQARDRFAELLGRVCFGKEHIVITRNGQAMGAFIPMEEYERLRHRAQVPSDGELTDDSGDPPPEDAATPLDASH